MPSFLETRSSENFKFPASAKNQIYGFALKEENKRFHVAPLSPVTLKLRVHYVRGQAPTICQMIFFDKDDPDATCPECEKPNLKYPGKPCLPTHVLMFLGYVYELKGKKGRSKNGNEFEESPVKVIAVPSGRKQANWGTIESAIDVDGDFMECVWRLVNANEGDKKGFQPPDKVASAAALKKLGEQFDLHACDEDKAKWAEETSEKIQSILMASVSGIPWVHPDMVEAGYANPYPKEEEGASTGSQDASDASTEEEEETPDVDTSVLD